MDMLRILVLVLSLFSLSSSLNKAQLRGIRDMMKGLHGVYATCKIVLFRKQVDYTTAENNCQQFSLGKGANTHAGNLATVNDKDKNGDLTTLLSMAYPNAVGKFSPEEWVWAGMRKVTNLQGETEPEDYDPDEWEWTDGSHPNETFSRWMENQPDQNSKKYLGTRYYQNQMRINHDGEWDDTYAYKEHPYACDYQGKYIVSGTLMTWKEAKKACENAGLALAKVRNDAEIEDIGFAIATFLGPERAKSDWEPSNWIWLGGNDIESEADWKWVDGDDMSLNGLPWDNWRSPNPDNAQFLFKSDMGQNSLAISKWGEFDDSYEVRRRRPFACQCPGT